MKFDKNKSYSFMERINPLWGLSIRESQMIYDTARNGNYARIQYIYSQIEKTDSVLLMCVDRRSSALLSLGWKIVPNKGVNNEQAQEQTRIAELFLNRIDNFSEAIEHLGLSFFRGFSHCSPVLDGFGWCSHIDCLNSWNFAQDPLTKQWYWNPEAMDSLAIEQLAKIPDGELISVVRPRAIDYPALPIYIRKTLAERDWGRFLERYGIPPCVITMPQGATREQEEQYREAAEAVAEALNGTLPFGSQVSFASEARGQDPFSAFLEYQQKQVVLLATGGTLTSLSESGSGTLAGNAQMDVWKEIVARDASVIGDAVDKGLLQPFLKKHFGTSLIHFEIGKDEEQTASEILDLSGKLVQAGYRADKEWIAERTGIVVADEVDLSQQDEFANVVGNAKTIRKKKTAIEKAFCKDLEKTLAEAEAIINEKDEAQFLNSVSAFLAKDDEDLVSCDNLADILGNAMATAYADTITEIKEDKPFTMEVKQ